MKVKNLRLILNLAKQKDKKKFLNAIDEGRLLENLNQLGGKETSQLIYSFSKVEVNDMRYWKQLNQQFLKTQSAMNSVDLVMCSYAFAKNYLSNTHRYLHKENQDVVASIWQQLEVSILKNEEELLFQQQQSSNIGLLMYSFHILNKGSPQIWNMMIEILVKQIGFIDQRNIAMCCYVLGKRNINDDKIWNAVRKEIILPMKEFTWKNVMLIIYSFSRMNKADEELWRAFEDTVIFQAERRQTKHTTSSGGIALSGRDISQVLWSFASLKKGTPAFWELMENILMDNIQYLDIKSFNKCLFSFYFAEKGTPEFWQFISKMNINIHTKTIDATSLDDVLFLARIFQTKTDEKVSQFNFSQLMQKYHQIVDSAQYEQIILESRARLSFHQILLEKDSKLQQKKMFEIFLKKLKIASEGNDQKVWIQMYIDFTYMIFTLNLQDKLYHLQQEANRLLIQKMTEKQSQQDAQQRENEENKIIIGMSQQISEKDVGDHFLIGDQQRKYYSKQYSGVAWVLYLNLNKAKNISFEHRLELLKFLFTNFNIFLETDKKFSSMIQKIIVPLSSDKRIFEFLLQQLEHEKISNPLQHLYLIFLICNRYHYRLDTFNLKNLLARPKDEESFKSQFNKIINKYKEMYEDQSKFDIKQLLEFVLSHFLLQKQKVEDILNFSKEMQSPQQQQSSLVSDIQLIKQDNITNQKDSDKEQIQAYIHNQSTNEEEKI